MLTSLYMMSHVTVRPQFSHVDMYTYTVSNGVFSNDTFYLKHFLHVRMRELFAVQELVGHSVNIELYIMHSVVLFHIHRIAPFVPVFWRVKAVRGTRLDKVMHKSAFLFST